MISDLYMITISQHDRRYQSQGNSPGNAIHNEVPLLYETIRDVQEVIRDGSTAGNV
ncbi:hypothetical protein D3C76_347410 [compost metagenome]